MANKKETSKGINRRHLLGGATAIGSLVIASKSFAQVKPNPDNLPPNVPEWTPDLGPGVDVNPYGMPSQFEENVFIGLCFQGKGLSNDYHFIIGIQDMICLPSNSSSYLL